MTKHDSPSQKKEQKKIGKQQSGEKKLHKREQRLQESLQKAQAEQAKAQARLERAEARLQKRLARAQRLEDHLAQVRQQLGVEQGPPLVLQPEPSSSPSEAASVSSVSSASPLSAENTPDAASSLAVPPLSAQTSGGVPATEIASAPSSPDISTADSTTPLTPSVSEAAQQVARAVAEAVEEEVRIAAERALTASHQLDEAPQTTNEAEHVADALDDVSPEQSVVSEEALEAMTITGPTDDTSSTEKPLSAGPSPEEIRRVAEIAREEEQLEEGVVRTHAEAAAATAAEAEALAESSSARTRKARILARQADQELTLVRAAIRNGSLTGERAEATLQAAERKSTHAHAELDDAEDAEERAISAARNAEAEAEVAEEMAFSAYDRYVHDVDGRAVQAIAEQEEQQRADVAQLQTEADESTNENTEKRSVVRPQVWSE
jgi:hypothetical protein